MRATAWRRACRDLIAGDGPATMLGTATTARIDLMPHQLEPVLAVVRGDGSRVLIADEVGLGKTIQAALIATELKARGAATRALILAPAGLREQWVNELRSRFDLIPALLDMREIARRRAQLPVGQPVDRRAAGRHVRRLHQATGVPPRSAQHAGTS